MKKITFKVYKEAIIKQYLIAQKEDASGILSIPTPAQLRDFCSLKCDRGLSVADEEVMKVFFETKAEETLKRSIEQCNIDKFRPIISFLRGEKDTENQTRVAMAAIIVDFKPRPYSAFLNSYKVEDNGLPRTKSLELKNEKEIDQPKKDKKNIRLGYVVLLVLGLFCLGFVIKSFVWPEKQCMQWQGDHYEPIDCQSEVKSMYATAPIIPFDENLVELNKLEVCDTTTFFKAGKAIVWYCKVNGDPEYFDGPGYHPITGNGLKPITEYIIDKYIRHK